MHKQSVPFMTLLLALAALSAPGVSAAPNDGTCESEAFPGDYLPGANGEDPDCGAEEGASYIIGQATADVPEQCQPGPGNPPIIAMQCVTALSELPDPCVDTLCVYAPGACSAGDGTPGATLPLDQDYCWSNDDAKDTQNFAVDLAQNNQHSITQQLRGTGLQPAFAQADGAYETIGSPDLFACTGFAPSHDSCIVKDQYCSVAGAEAEADQRLDENCDPQPTPNPVPPLPIPEACEDPSNWGDGDAVSCVEAILEAQDLPPEA